jgi:hypothetical protein
MNCVTNVGGIIGAMSSPQPRGMHLRGVEPFSRTEICDSLTASFTLNVWSFRRVAILSYKSLRTLDWGSVPLTMEKEFLRDSDCGRNFQVNIHGMWQVV